MYKLQISSTEYIDEASKTSWKKYEPRKLERVSSYLWEIEILQRRNWMYIVTHFLLMFMLAWFHAVHGEKNPWIYEDFGAKIRCLGKGDDIPQFKVGCNYLCIP